MYLAKQFFFGLVNIAVARREKHNMNGTKNLFLSKTVWGVIIQLIAVGTMSLGYDIGDQGMMVNAIVGAIGAVLAIVGRIKAVKKIG